MIKDRQHSTGLAVRQLRLSAFRNYEAAELAPEGDIVVLTGDNGAGKTNILEAVSLLGAGRGLRGAALADLQKIDDPRPWAVYGELEGRDGQFSVGTAAAILDDPSQRPVRRVRIDGASERSSGVLDGHVKVVWLTPAQDRLFAGPASGRRHFLDRIVVSLDSAHRTRLNRFEKVMRERNRLLSETTLDPVWLSGLELQLAEQGVAIAAARRDAVASLTELSERDETGRGGGVFPRAGLEIDGELENLLNQFPAVDVEDKYRKLLHDSRDLDGRAGRTSHGPHRSDLAVVYTDRGMPARRCSTGEQKALLIRIVMAHAQCVAQAFATAPLVLLDEIAAHLDDARRVALFGHLMGMGGQVWVTGTDAALFSQLGERTSAYTIADGTITAA